MKEKFINMDVKSIIWIFLLIYGYFCLLFVEMYDFCKMEWILINWFEIECVLCFKNLDIDCLRNVMKLIIDNGYKNC